jgi:hypothetical protein
MTTQAPPRGGWLEVREERGRLLARWGFPDADLWQASLADWRTCVVRRHGDGIWRPGYKCWSLPATASARRRLEEWASTWFHDEEIEWEDSGTEANARADERMSSAAALAEAYTVLCLTPAAPRELVGAARRILSKVAHPDHGGDEQAQQRLNAAHDTIVAALEPVTSHS